MPSVTDSPVTPYLDPNPVPPPLFGEHRRGPAVVARPFPELFDHAANIVSPAKEAKTRRSGSPVSPSDALRRRFPSPLLLSPVKTRRSPAVTRSRLGSTPLTPMSAGDDPLGFDRLFADRPAKGSVSICLPPEALKPGDARLRRASKGSPGGTPVRLAPSAQRGEDTPPSRAAEAQGTPVKLLQAFGTPDKLKSAGPTPKRRCTPTLIRTPNAAHVRTPVAPCVRRDYDELRTDLARAVQAGALPELLSALDRKHACAASHPLHEAVRCQDAGALSLLVSAHAADLEGECCAAGVARTPLQVCCALETWRDAERVELAEVLLRAGADVNRRAGGSTALHIAARQHAAGLLGALLRARADPNGRDAEGRGPLEAAVAAARTLRAAPDPFAKPMTAAVELLLASGACPVLPEAVRARGAECPGVASALRKAELWWRSRVVAWIRVRGDSACVVRLMPEELLRNVTAFL